MPKDRCLHARTRYTKRATGSLLLSPAYYGLARSPEFLRSQSCGRPGPGSVPGQLAVGGAGSTVYAQMPLPQAGSYYPKGAVSGVQGPAGSGPSSDHRIVQRDECWMSDEKSLRIPGKGGSGIARSTPGWPHPAGLRVLPEANPLKPLTLPCGPAC